VRVALSFESGTSKEHLMTRKTNMAWRVRMASLRAYSTAAALLLLVLAAGCGGSLQVVAHSPQRRDDSALRAGKIGRVDLRVGAPVAADPAKQKALDEHEVIQHLQHAIESALEQGGHYAAGGALTLRGELSNFRVKSAMWAGPGMGPDVAWLRLAVYEGQRMLKAFEAKSLDASGSWSTTKRLSRLLSQAAQEAVDGI
jgi:hypothetical protein